MEAVGEALQLGLRIRLDPLQLVADDARQWRGLALRLADQKPRDLVRLVQEPLRHADIDHEHVGHELRQHAQRRQFCAVADRRCRALLLLQIAQRLPRHQRLARRRDEAAQIGGAEARCIADIDRQRHRLDAEQPDRAPVDLDPALQHRRDRPAGAAELDEQLLRKGRGIRRDQHRRARAAEGRRGAVIGVAGLLVDRLHAAPQRGRRDQPDQERRELHLVAPPMAEQHGEDPQRAPHAIRPACRLTWRSSVAARCRLCVTIRKPQPVRVTRSRVRASTSSAVASSRLPVGSSASSNDGFVASARPIATRCCCPPDNCSG